MVAPEYYRYEKLNTAWKVSKYGVISGPHFLVFRPEIAPYFDTFHAVKVISNALR